MTLREKIFKTFIVTIREINLHGGPEKFFEKYPVGGMYYGEADVLRDENGLEIGTQLDFDKLNECKKYSKTKLLVCADSANARGQKIKNKKKAYPSTQRVYKVNSEALEHSFMPHTSNISNIS